MKVALVLNDDFSMYHFRGGLIKTLVGKGLDVSVIVPPGTYAGKLESLGARCLNVNIKRFLSPLNDLLLLWNLYSIFRSARFDLVHNMTVKPNIYGTIAARLARTARVVCLVSGSGFLFGHPSVGTGTVLRRLTMFLYAIALRLANKTWFQNSEDFDMFVHRGLIRPAKGVVIRSGGINVDEYRPGAVSKSSQEALRKELNIPPQAKMVLMVAARLIWSKGVKEFVEGARSLQDTHPDWFFVMVCPRDPASPDSVPEEYLMSNTLARLIVVDEFRDDIKTFEAMSDIMVLPSYYPEGVPRTLLEGLAMAKPIVTTDNQGCREVVEEGRNGFLAPVRDSRALALRLSELMTDPEKRERFGRESRLKAESEFSEEIVVKRIMRELYEIPAD
jgi:N,N'-diacetylbacillosaminyl-diphospho-undecaprenol alpha-1,3-N-acetylgalactosaminyltransferase